MHKYFTMWVKAGAFENMMRDAAQLVEERGEYRKGVTLDSSLAWPRFVFSDRFY